MTFTATVQPYGERFTIEPGETVLDAALRAGVTLNYGCRHGNCSTCKYLLLDGEVDFGAASPYSLPESERDEGFALLCCATPLSNLEIEVPRPVDDRAAPAITPAEYVSEVAGVEPVTDDLWRLQVRTATPLAFYPGQFVELAHPGGADWRCYSIASPPDSPILEFVVKRVEGGAFSGQLGTLRAGDPVRLRGPYGASYLRRGEAPVLCCATGSGIAPILSMLCHAGATGDRRTFTLFYGARGQADLRVLDQLSSAQTPPNVTLVPVLSQPDLRWSGQTGRITAAIQARIRDASDYDVYVCGAPEMCDTVARLLEAKGVRDGRLFFDRFHPALG